MLGFGKHKGPQLEELNTNFLLGAIVDGVILVDGDNTIKLFSPAASSITGWKVEEAMGLDFRSVLVITDEHGQPYPPELHPFAQALRTRSTVRDSRGLLTTKSGKLVPISLIVSPIIENVEQMSTGVLGVLRDITAEKKEESQRSEFVSTASHEMRTPIAAIEGYLSLALNPKVANIDARGRNLLEKAHAATEHLSQLFVDLLTSAKAEDGRLASYPKVIELGEVIEQITDATRFTAEKKGLGLKYVLSSGTDIRGGKVVRPLFYVYVDTNLIREVLQNLVDNAVKYTNEGSVTITLTGDSTVVQVQIKDSGIGIAEEDIPHLFQKFYRVDNSMTRTVGGTGLGLFICKKIIELYNGRIWVDSRAGQGSTFFINLPRLTTEQALHMQQSEASTLSPLDNP
jgi:PAS domain S-box-containing protein